MHPRPNLAFWRHKAATIAAFACGVVAVTAGCMPDFDALSGGAIAAGAGGAGTGDDAGSGGDAGSAGVSGAAGSAGRAGSAGAGDGGSSGDAPDGGAGNLILNADFEELVVRWTPIGNCQLRIVSEPPAQSGSRCLQVSNRTVEWEGPGYSVLNLLDEGKIYDVGVWVHVAEGEIPLQLTHKRRCAGEAEPGGFTPMGSPVIATSAWTYLSGTITAPACEQTLESVFFVEVPGTSNADPNAYVTFYLDNASLLEVAP